MAFRKLIFGTTLGVMGVLLPEATVAQYVEPFKSGWTLEGSASDLNFMSVKQGTKMELSKFATLDGIIAEDGTATFEVALDSVDTNVDLRNVRLRFLLFETFAHPKATVSTKLTEAMLGDLAETGVLRMTLPFDISLHGFSKSLSADVIVSLAGPDQVTVASVAPIILQLDEFGLIEGRNKLQDTAEVKITPATAITFALTFKRNDATSPAAAPLVASVRTDNVALEPAGVFSEEACRGRFEILSRAGNINFDKGSAQLRRDSRLLISSIADIMRRCPTMLVEVGGHTDSIGRPELNARLSQARAQSVVDALVGLGLPATNLVSRGYGEALPIASNATIEGRSRNRRIEFSVLSSGSVNG